MIVSIVFELWTLITTQSGTRFTGWYTVAKIFVSMLLMGYYVAGCFDRYTSFTP